MNQLSLLFLINRLQLSCLCLSAFSLLACEPYEKCDESLKVGDELTFKLTEGPSVQEQIDECGAPLPFDVDSVFHLTVERFVGGDQCNSSTGLVRLDDLDLVRLDDYDQRTASKFHGYYQLDHANGCSFFLKFEFYEDGMYYRASGSIYQSDCPFQACVGSFKGEWVD